MMEREAGRMTYVAWRRDIEVRLISKTREDARHPEWSSNFGARCFKSLCCCMARSNLLFLDKKVFVVLCVALCLFRRVGAIG